jgi:hypothetical protein
MTDVDHDPAEDDERWGWSDLPASLLLAATGALMLVASWLLWERFGLLSVSGAVVGALVAVIGLHGTVRSAIGR